MFYNFSSNEKPLIITGYCEKYCSRKISRTIVFLLKLDLTRTQPQDSKEKWKIYAKKFANKIEVESPADKWDKYVQKVVDKEAKKKEENSEKFDSLNDKYQQEIEKEEIERKRKELEDDSEDSDDLESDECASSDEEGVTKEVDSEINVLEDRQDCNTENEEKTELENEQFDMTVISHDILKIASNLEKQSEKQNLEFLENSLVADVNCKDEVTPDAEDTLTDKKAEGQREVKENINEETQKFGDQAFTDRSNVDRKSINNNDKGKKNVPTPKANIESYIHEKNEKGQNGERNEDDDSNKESNQNNEQEEVNNNTLDNLLNPEESKEEVNNNTLDNLLNPEESRTNNDRRLLQCTEKVETMEDLEDAILQEVALMKKGLTVRSIEVDNLIQQLDFDIT